MSLVQADAMFADLIGEDPHWLRAEFDALILGILRQAACAAARAFPGPAASRLAMPPSRCRRPAAPSPMPVARPAYRRQCSPPPAAAPG